MKNTMMMIKDFSKPISDLTAALDAANLLRGALKPVAPIDLSGLAALVETLTDRADKLQSEVKARMLLRASYHAQNSARSDARRLGIAAAERELQRGQEAVDRARVSMRKAGVPESIAISSIADFDSEACKRVIQELTADGEAWLRFNQTGLAEDLPKSAMPIDTPELDLLQGVEP